MNAAPLGWKAVAISEVAQVVGGGTPPSKDQKCFAAPGQGIPWVTPADLSGYKLQEISRGSRDLTPAGLAACSAKLLPAGAVLFSSRAPIGYVAIASGPVATNQGFKSFVFPEGIDSRFAYYQLRHIKPVAEALATGTTFKELSGSAAAKLPFLLAPGSEQKRIADKLDTVLTRVDAVNTRLARVAPILKRFRQSVLAAATSGQLTEDWRRLNADVAVHSQWRQRHNKSAPPPDIKSLNIQTTWRIHRAQDVVETDANIVYGIVQPGPKLVSGIPYVQTTDIADGRIQVGSLCRTSVDIANRYHRSSIKGGDVLLGIIRATKVAVVPDELSGGNISRSVARLRPGSDMVPQFLAIALESPAVQDWLHAQHRGMDMPVLNLAQVRLAPLPIAPIDEQREIVRRVGTLFAFADRLEARLRTARTATERLTPALLAKAFRGELVPQDPNDEPASELLRRLQKEAPSTTTKRGRKSAE